MRKRFDRAAASPELAAMRNDAIGPLHTPSTKRQGDFWVNLRCPLCGKIKASAHADNPGRLYCWSGSCQASKGNGGISVDEYFGISIDYEKSYPPSATNKNSPAIAYLTQQRGLSPEVIEGQNIFYRSSIRGTGQGGVLLRIGTDSAGNEVANGRFFVTPPDGKKGHTEGKIGEFIHVAQEVDFNAELVIVEGWISEMSLWDMGTQSAAVFSAVANPETKQDFFEQCKRLVLCFDQDRNGAGQKAMRRWLRAYPQATPILLPQGVDANDLLVRHGKEKAAEIFRKKRPEYEFNAQLALAKTPKDYAECWVSFHGTAPGLFRFRGETFFSQQKVPRGSNQEPYLEVTKILQGTIDVIAFHRDQTTDNTQYHLKFSPANRQRKPITAAATGANLSKAANLNEFLLSKMVTFFSGDHTAARALQDKIVNAKAPIITVLPVLGYQQNLDSYFFASWGIDPSGKALVPDQYGHFPATPGSEGQYVKPPAHAEQKSINPADIEPQQVREILSLIGKGWGSRGLLALGWVVGSMFVTQIKAELNFYPHMAFSGSPASGKSSVLILLQCLQGRSGEGIASSSLNSRKGVSRSLSGVSNLFSAIIEDNSRDGKNFDQGLVLTAYNTSGGSVSAAFSNDLRVKETPMLGTLLWSANTEPFQSRAEKMRIVSLFFRNEDLTPKTKQAYDQLMQIDQHIRAGFIKAVLTNRNAFESQWKETYETAKGLLEDNIPEHRILCNHALCYAFYILTCGCFDLAPEPAVLDFTADIGRKKCISSALRNAEASDHFFEMLNHIQVPKDEHDLKDDKGRDKHTSAYFADEKRDLLLVNLPSCERALRDKSFNLQVNNYLLESLQKHPAYVANSTRFRFPYDRERAPSGRQPQRRVWAFRLPWFSENSREVLEIINQ
ncbi:toprim domain-containing protein [Desulfobulbus rhabdoformis]|uniref:toprim domain-containing protein n=1 Tax=Desulfobulbus rhabdoformis TaxID=34032 RepID=UPI0019660E2F|nr:toprim domain-containing protein [Desulfobulbus rhabdoformis]MBM9615974.1 toprim domain-containing protein [Desulfobulbus rhabdoformis]